LTVGKVFKQHFVGKVMARTIVLDAELSPWTTKGARKFLQQNAIENDFNVQEVKLKLSDRLDFDICTACQNTGR
jgi:hypothetical protein